MLKSGALHHLRQFKRRLHPALHRPDSRIGYKVLGTDYGGWPVINDSLHYASRVLSFGIGHDITFDLEVISRFGCKVEAFDPTPRCIAWLNEQDLPDQFRAYPVGLSDRAQILRFSAPPEDTFVSYTIARRDESPEVVELPVRPLDEIMRDLGYDELDFMKMDIEGSEYQVIDDMLAKGILPQQLCVEFHHGMFGYTAEQTKKAVADLRNDGYGLHYVSAGGREYGFHRLP